LVPQLAQNLQPSHLVPQLGQNLQPLAAAGAAALGELG